MSSARLLSSSKLSKELQEALQADAKRQAIDSAKKRAVGQHVDYETFKNMVAVAHLKPLQDTSSSVKVTAAPAWQFSADGSVAKARRDDSFSLKEFGTSQQDALPNTADAFLRAWRKQSPTQDAKWQLLVKCGAAKLQAWFKTSLPANVISDILVVCHARLQEFSTEMQQSHVTGHLNAHLPHSAQMGPDKLEQACLVPALVYKVLEALTGSGRFELTVKLLNKQAKQAIPQIFGFLQMQLSRQTDGLDYAEGQVSHLQSLYSY